ncbi:hypothetical protein HID58_008459, partial [Brassica napus]
PIVSRVKRSKDESTPAAKQQLKHFNGRRRIERKLRLSSLMAKEQILRPWFLDLVPALVILLAAAHVIALGYWIYRLATDRRAQSQRGKFH